MTSLGPRGDEYDNAVPKPTASEGRPASATEHSPEGDYEELGSIGYDDTSTGYDDIAETGVDDSGEASGSVQYYNTATRATPSQVRPAPATEPSPEGAYMELR